MMQASQPSLFSRDDTFFGVCEALGEDFGFNPLFLRVAFGVAVLWNPAVVLATYVALGVVVAATRLIFPDPRRAARKKEVRVQNDAGLEAADQQHLPQNDDQPADVRQVEFA